MPTSDTPSLQNWLGFAPQVAEALYEKRPVVALESTIISHGMPWPKNYETALEVEETVRRAGAIPATIAVLNRKIHIGLSSKLLERLAKTAHVRKLSSADLAHALIKGETGSTTVAATMLCAELAKIAVFATGGIGGVHYGVKDSFDISADLHAFLRSSLIVVSAGAKAILDIAKTLEMLETLNVPVIAYGTNAFPAFWSQDSGLKAPLSLDTPEEVAQLFLTRKRLGQKESLLLAAPVPKAHEIPRQVLAPLIGQAQSEAEQKGVNGKSVTPFLLQRILELTKGESLDANIALIKNNARLAAEIAKSLAREGKQGLAQPSE